MEFRILGPLEVHDDSGPLSLGPIKPRAVLAVLLLHPNEPVSAERLALALWGEEAPADATRTVQVYISRLRKALGDPERITRTRAGYRLDVRPGELDAERFERDVQAGRRALDAGQPVQAAGLLHEAMGMWRGPPLAELEFERFAQVEIARLQEQRLAALEARVEADLRAGRHAALVGELRRLLAEYPTRERFASDLMLALYRSGRQAEALEVYREARRVLVDEAGVEPGPELQRLHQAVLEHDPSLELQAGDLPPALDIDAAPAFVGRDAELSRLREHWKAAASGASRLVVVRGPPGSGKTRLAAELAGEVHRAGGAVEYVVARAASTAGAVLLALREAQRPTLVVLDDADGVRDAIVAALGERTRLAARQPVMVIVCSRDYNPLSGLALDEALVLGTEAARALGSRRAAKIPGLPPANVVDELARDALPPGAARRRALPLPPNRTIGRARQVGAVVERLRAEHMRLLTLTGPGGVGKTRLALEAARAVRADFADGAHLVSLAAIERPQDVPAAIVDALAIIPLTGESADQAVERFLAAKHLLLVLDNCEHLPDAAPFIGGLAGACPNVTVLTTSREPLAVHAEQCHPVPPLALPKRTTDPDEVARADAVTLFCERARAHDPEFELSAGNAGAVADICRRVDGLPLGIELAAARCALLSPEQIAERLHAALGALGIGPRDAPARQRTLRATIDWSHQLLDDDERACFARFAVFGGGATVEAAETVTGAGIDTLDRLVAKSLLVRRDVGGRARLRMLETIRAYSAEHLGALADSDAVRERHHRFYLALAQRHGTDPALTGASRKKHFSRLDPETGNLAAALEWAAAKNATAPLLELCAALVNYWFYRHRYAHAVEWIDRARSRPGGDPALRAHCLCAESPMLWMLGRRAEQPAVLEEADALTTTLPGTPIRAEVLRTRAVQETWNGRLDLASAFAEQAEACARATGDPWEIALAAYASALAADDQRELRARVDRAASLLEQTGDAFHLADLFESAGYRALCSDSDDDAAEFLARAIALTRELDNPLVWMFVVGDSGLAALFKHDIAGATAAFREQLELARELVVLPVAFKGLDGLAAVAALDGDLDRAARLHGAAGAHRYGEPENPVDVRVRDTFFTPARARHGAEAWDAAARAGAALGFRDAIVYALGEPRPQAAAVAIPSSAHH